MVPPQRDGALSGRCTVLRGAPLTATAVLSAIHLTGCSPSSPRPGIPAVASAQASEAAVVVPAGWAFEAWGMEFGQRQRVWRRASDPSSPTRNRSRLVR